MRTRATTKKNTTPRPRRRTVTPDERDRALALVVRQQSWVQRHVQRLAALPAHGNRSLHYDQVFRGLLLSFFDPVARSLRLIQDAGDFGGKLDGLAAAAAAGIARSTLSDALASFDPAHLRPIIDDLHRRIPALRTDHPDLATVTRQIIAADDGTYFTTVSDVLWALRHTKSNGRTQAQVRANVQLDVASWAPQVVTVSGDDGRSEPQAFAPDLLGGVLYVFDRNFLDFTFLKDLLAKGNALRPAHPRQRPVHARRRRARTAGRRRRGRRRQRPGRRADRPRRDGGPLPLRHGPDDQPQGRGGGHPPADQPDRRGTPRPRGRRDLPPALAGRSSCSSSGSRPGRGSTTC